MMLKLADMFRGPATHLPTLDELTYGNTRKGSVGVVVLLWECRDLSIRCLGKILKNTVNDPRCEGGIVVVDNGSNLGTSKAFLTTLNEYAGVMPVKYLRMASNLYWSAAINAGVRALDPCDIAVLINGDCEPKSDRWLDYFRDAMLPREVWVSGLVDTGLDVNGLRPMVAGSTYPNAGNVLRWLDTPGSKQRVHHWCVAVRMEAFQRAGLYLQEGAFTHFWSDQEFCARVRALGGAFAHVLPDVHHWHQMATLYRDRPEVYARLIRALQDPEMAREYLEKGRPLWEDEPS